MRTYRQTDRQTDSQTDITKLTVVFRNFTKAPKSDKGSDNKITNLYYALYMK